MALNQITLKKDNDIAFLIFDTPHKPLNMLNRGSFLELSALVNKIKNDDSIKAICLISGKEDNFIAGADIHEFEKIASAGEAHELLRMAQGLLNDIAQSPKPYIAAINGACLGGGLEIALACHYRIATLDKKTLFASPEVLLGLLPALGGTQRLPRLIGMQASLNFLLQGRKINAKKALKLGLLDYVVKSKGELFDAALGFIRQVALVNKPRSLKKLHFWELFRLAVAKRYSNKLSHGHYPAPNSIIETLKVGVIQGFDAGLKKEADEFAKLIEGDVSKNLIRLFFAQKERQKIPPKSSLSHESLIGIIGSGLMGSGIATVSLMHKKRVFLNDNSSQALAKAHAHIWHELKQNLDNEKISKLEYRRAMSNLSLSESLDQLSHCDAVIEAIVEDLPVKINLLRKIELLLKDDCIFASNTSSIPIREIAQNSHIKDRIIGMHYFSPVEKMPLLEIVKSSDTSPKTLERAYEIGVQQGKTVIIVNDSPGFYTTRIIAALFDEASVLLLEGVRPTEIDSSLQKLGFPLGPMALMDQVGLDVGYHISKILYERLGSRLISADLKLCERMIEAQFLGRKSGKGFYLYTNHRAAINPGLKEIIDSLEISSRPKHSTKISSSERMLYRMVNEAAYCLSENVLNTPEDGDVGAVFGLGFPAYLGGPFKFIQDQGSTVVAKKLDSLREHYGERFNKAPFFS